MNIDLMQIVAELGGGPGALIIVGLGIFGWRKDRRADQLTDKFISAIHSQNEAMNNLAREIERANQK